MKTLNTNETTTPVPALSDGLDPDLLREQFNEAGNAYLFARAAYRALPKTPAEVLDALPEGAGPQDRYEALQAASTAVRAAFTKADAAREAVMNVAYELIGGFPSRGEVSMLALYERAFTDAGMKEWATMLDANAKAARYDRLREQDAAADNLENARRSLAEAQEQARQSGLRV